jgi:hypothetical protein
MLNKCLATISLFFFNKKNLNGEKVMKDIYKREHSKSEKSGIK